MESTYSKSKGDFSVGSSSRNRSQRHSVINKEGSEISVISVDRENPGTGLSHLTSPMEFYSGKNMDVITQLLHTFSNISGSNGPLNLQLPFPYPIMNPTIKQRK